MMRLAFLLMYFVVSSTGRDGQVEQVLPEVNVKQLKRILASDPEAVLVDVRSAAEIARGVLPGEKIYVEYGKSDFEEKLAGLEKSGSYYVYCHSGLRSAVAVDFLRQKGYKNVYNVKGGMAKWTKNGYATE